MKNLLAFVLTAALAIVGLFAGFYAYRWYEHTQVWNVIIFRMPDGYRGIFTIVEDSANGVAPVNSLGPDGHPVYEVSVPVDGKVRVKSMDPFFGWIKYEAFYESGAPLPYEGPIDNVALRALGKMNDRSYFLVGTTDESRRWFTDHKEWRTLGPGAPDQAGKAW